MASVAEKKAILSLSDGTSVNLNKPIDIPDSVTDITQITEPGWYHGKFTFQLSGEGAEADSWIDGSSIKNTPATKIALNLTVNTEYNFDVLVTKTGDYIFNFVKYLFYGVVKTNNSISWEIVSPLVVDDLTSTSSNKALSAAQGKVLNDKISKLTKTDTVGSAANPVYMKNGTITAGTYTFSASTIDLTARTSTLATNEIRFIYE